MAKAGSPKDAFVLRGGTVVTCDPSNRVVRADVSVEDGVIRAIGKVRKRKGLREISARGHIVMPGLVMAHVHLCQALMRGMADDLPLLDWLKKRIWPLEAAHDSKTLRASSELGLAELLLGGSTAILDLGTVHGHDVVFDAALRSGIRVLGGKSLMDSGAGVPRGLRQSAKQELADGERLEATWHNHESGRIRYAWIPRFILSCTERLIRGAVERARASGAYLHTHASEHPGERKAVRDILGKDDVDVLRSWGMYGTDSSFAHGVQLSAAQIKRLAKDGSRVVHCPSANLKLGSGIASVAKLRAAGVVVGIGPDGAPCNNNLDPWVEIRRAALLSCAVAGPGELPSMEVLRMATIDGAKVLGWDDHIGSVEIGKRADLIVVRGESLHTVPSPDPVSQLVYATTSRDVLHVFIDGQPIVSDSELQTLETPRVIANARRQAKRLMSRARLR